MSSFKDFDLAELKIMESRVLCQLNFNLTPQITPSGFVQELLHIWEQVNSVNSVDAVDSAEDTNHSCVVDKNLVAAMSKVANGLIAEFWSEPSSLLYASSTIAVSAVILAFSILHLDCSDWLASVPNCCLPVPSLPVPTDSSPPSGDTAAIAANTPNTANVRQLLDVDACLVSFARVPSLCPPPQGRPATTTPVPCCRAISPTSKAITLSPEMHERSVLPSLPSTSSLPSISSISPLPSISSQSAQSACPSRPSRCHPTDPSDPVRPPTTVSATDKATRLPTTVSATDKATRRPDGPTRFQEERMRGIKKRSLCADLASFSSSGAFTVTHTGDDDDDGPAAVRRRIAV